MNSVTTDQFRQLYLQAPLEGTAMNPTPNGQPQGCDKDAPPGRMARSLTQREDWTRDLGGCLTAPGGNQPQRPRYG